MTHLRLSEAARQVGVSRPTIYKYAADGLLSVTKDRLGHKQVELSELLRVFGELSTETQKTTQTDKDRDTFTSVRQTVKTGKTTQTDSLSALLVELERAKAQLESKVVETALLRERVDELKARERTSQEERSRLMAMLEQSQRLLAAPVPAQRALARRKAVVPAPAPVAPTRIPARKKAVVAAPVPVLAPVAPLAPGRAPARKQAAAPVPVPAALTKTGAAKKFPSSKASVPASKPR